MQAILTKSISVAHKYNKWISQVKKEADVIYCVLCFTPSYGRKPSSSSVFWLKKRKSSQISIIWITQNQNIPQIAKCTIDRDRDEKGNNYHSFLTTASQSFVLLWYFELRLWLWTMFRPWFRFWPFSWHKEDRLSPTIPLHCTTNIYELNHKLNEHTSNGSWTVFLHYCRWNKQMFCTVHPWLIFTDLYSRIQMINSPGVNFQGVFVASSKG